MGADYLRPLFERSAFPVDQGFSNSMSVKKMLPANANFQTNFQGFSMNSIQRICAVALVAASAHTSAVAVDPNAFLHVSFPGSVGGAWQASVMEPNLTWSCAAGASADCEVSGSISVAISRTTPLSGDALSVGLRMNLFAAGVAEVVNPNGGMTDLVVDLNQWTFSASGTIKTDLPGTPLFMTAYGKNQIATSAMVNFGSSNSALSLTAQPAQQIDPMTTQLSTTFGPAGAGALAFPRSRASFAFTQTVETPYFAYPSTTNPRCKDLSCLDYYAGTYTPDPYVLTFNIFRFPADVPEPSVLWMMSVGMALVVVRLRRG